MRHEVKGTYFLRGLMTAMSFLGISNKRKLDIVVGLAQIFLQSQPTIKQEIDLSTIVSKKYFFFPGKK